MKILAAFIAIGASMAGAQASAQTSAEFARMGKLAWEAFECSAYADYTKDVPERGRLFSLGIAQGRSFVAAVRGGKIQDADAEKIVPVAVIFSLQGPSTDFVVGRIFGEAASFAADRVWGRGNIGREETTRTPDEETRKATAQAAFRENNCDALR